MKNVQISQELFYYLLKYFLLEDKSSEKDIKRMLSDKVDSIAKRIAYTEYKTSDSPEEREKARQKYLDMVGMNEDFRY